MLERKFTAETRIAEIYSYGNISRVYVLIQELVPLMQDIMQTLFKCKKSPLKLVFVQPHQNEMPPNCLVKY